MTERIASAAQARRALDALPCPTCGATHFVREAELTAQGLRYQTCAKCGTAREVVLALPEEIEAGLAGLGMYDVATFEALAGWVGAAFPEYASPKSSTDTRGLDVGAGWKLVEWLRGSTGNGQGRCVDGAGTRALITVTRPQDLPRPELSARVALAARGITPILSIETFDDHAILREAEPYGIPLSTAMFPLPPDGALRVLAGILDILVRAAAAGEVVRGLRPELVYLGDGLAVSGLAPRAERFAGSMRQSRDLQPSNPFDALYVSPEQIRGGEATIASDVYSACLVFLFALTRRAPFPLTGNFGAVMMAMLQGPPEIPASVPAPLAERIRAALSPAPEQRPTARELLAALEGSGYFREVSRFGERAVVFEEADAGPVRYRATVGGRRWDVRVNAKPAARYALYIEGAIAEEHDTWPPAWTRHDDPHERAEYERELDHFERTRGIAPSKLVE